MSLLRTPRRGLCPHPHSDTLYFAGANAPCLPGCCPPPPSTDSVCWRLVGSSWTSSFRRTSLFPLLALFSSKFVTFKYPTRSNHPSSVSVFLHQHILPKARPGFSPPCPGAEHRCGWSWTGQFHLQERGDRLERRPQYGVFNGCREGREHWWGFPGCKRVGQWASDTIFREGMCWRSRHGTKKKSLRVYISINQSTERQHRCVE